VTVRIKTQLNQDLVWM